MNRRMTPAIKVARLKIQLEIEALKQKVADARSLLKDKRMELVRLSK